MLLGVWISSRLRYSRFGRALRAIAGSEQAASALGIKVSRYKLAAFVIAALYASAAGSLFAHFVGFISPEVFGANMVVLSFTMLFLGGIGTTWGPVIGALIVSLLPEVAARPQGTSGRRLLRRPHLHPDLRAQRSVGSRRHAVEARRPGEDLAVALLSIRDVTMRFGGLVANDSISIDVPEGMLFAVIGPNGAGKTTLFNVVSGTLTPTAGSVHFDGEDDHRHAAGPGRRARPHPDLSARAALQGPDGRRERPGRLPPGDEGRDRLGAVPPEMDARPGEGDRPGDAQPSRLRRPRRPARRSRRPICPTASSGSSKSRGRSPRSRG